jgi:geranylgeranyl diphosphate synthase type II
MSSNAIFLSSLLADWTTSVNQRLAEMLPPSSNSDGVRTAMRDALLAPGKRLRPMLVLATGRTLGCDSPALLDAACAVEMVHAASLVLDDIPCMDNARLRRGRPAIHVRHGEDAAVLAAVALLAQACATAAALPGVDSAVRTQVVSVLCNAVGEQGLVRGQYRDLREGASARSLQAIAETNDQKTGVLFACALELAALIAGAPQSVACLRAMATELGQAFQLKDDLEDISPTAPTGKDRNQDIGKSTLVAALGRAGAQQRLRQHLEAAERFAHELGADSAMLVALMHRAFTMQIETEVETRSETQADAPVPHLTHAVAAAAPHKVSAVEAGAQRLGAAALALPALSGD